MGAKDPANARDARADAKSGGSGDVPDGQDDVVKPCKNAHFFTVRVEFDNRKLVESGIKMKVKLNNGEVRDIVLSPGAQPGGKYATGKILVKADVCEVSFPDLYDAECTTK